MTYVKNYCWTNIHHIDMLQIHSLMEPYLPLWKPRTNPLHGPGRFFVWIPYGYILQPPLAPEQAGENKTLHRTLLGYHASRRIRKGALLR